MQPPYIGITGFMSVSEVLRMASVQYSLSARRRELKPVRDLMVGVLVSLKTLAGGTNKWPGRYPKVDDIKSIFTGHPHMVNLIHYNTDDPTTLARQLLELHELAGEHLHGFQLNVAWPDMGQLRRYRMMRADRPRIVLQIGDRAMREVDGVPGRIAERVHGYGDLVDDILIDPSGGLGEPFNTEIARIMLAVVKERCPSVNLGVAGGLHPDSLGLVEPLLKEFPELSIDAEGRLRRKPQDDLDIVVAEQYFRAAHDLFERLT